MAKFELTPLWILTIIFDAIIWLFYVGCVVCEVIIVKCVFEQIHIDCVQHFEISAGTELFLICSSFGILTDCAYVVVGIVCLHGLYAHPYTTLYNGLMCIFCLVAGLYPFTTNCKKQEDIRICLEPLMGGVSKILAAGVMHILIGIMSGVLCSFHGDFGIIWKERFEGLCKKE